MDAPLTFNGQTPWTNSPEAWAEIEQTSLGRFIKRTNRLIAVREATDTLAGR